MSQEVVFMCRFAAPSLLSEDDDDDDDPDYVEEEEEPLYRPRPRRAVSGSRAPLNDDLPWSPEVDGATIHSPDAGNGYPSEVGKHICLFPI